MVVGVAECYLVAITPAQEEEEGVFQLTECVRWVGACPAPYCCSWHDVSTGLSDRDTAAQGCVSPQGVQGQ
jgi:hypothetical protein